jgi:hypothetical protein
VFRPKPLYLIVLFVFALLLPFLTNFAFKKVEVESLPAGSHELMPDSAVIVDKQSVPLKRSDAGQPALLHPAPVSPAPGITITKPDPVARPSQEIAASGINTAEVASSRAKASATSGISRQAQDAVPRDMFAEGVTISKHPAAPEKKAMQEKQIIAW